MVVVEQLCVKSYEVTDEDGSYWKAEQGKTYTTTVPSEGEDSVTVFSNFWVKVPKVHFVLSEKKTTELIGLKPDDAPVGSCARIELVVALQVLASHYENALYVFGDDSEARRKAEGDIAHAMKVAARHLYNGPGCRISGN